MISDKEKEIILEKAQDWFKESVIQNHLRNTRKLKKASKFKINAFTTTYLANFLIGDTTPESIAKALLYPRILATSINTTFGRAIQKFTSEVLDSFGSTTAGIDIEYIDKDDGRRKYCQIKAGPETINFSDVETLHSHFKAIKNLARTNNKSLQIDDMVVGIVYGDRSQLSANYKKLENDHHYNILIGKEFWTKLTGDDDFYEDLIAAINEVAEGFDFSEELDLIVKELAQDPKILELSCMANKEI
ncbi:PmeII family type II restriction endonuclease [Acinetobacter sp. YH16051]|uniref:PmeII family type II restriction endonuclease n=1 Tax=Acinetobacter sp. YH16051 TaxID=2601190 RepID=UPI0015D4185A|nr:PmeII family type II restriction endonuclease [Acinetobacter sp. YH16051]